MQDNILRECNGTNRTRTEQLMTCRSDVPGWLEDGMRAEVLTANVLGH